MIIALGAAGARAEDECPEPAGEMQVVLPAHVRCQPRPGDSISYRFGGELLVGHTDRDVGTAGVTGGIAVPFDVSLTPAFAVGARAQWSAVGDERTDLNGDRDDDEDTPNHHALLLTAGPRLSVFTEPARREAWRFEVGGGYLLVVDDVAPSGPVVEAAVARQAGSLTVDGPQADTGTGWAVALTLRAQQGVGDASDYRAILLGASFTPELSVPLPEGRPPRRVRPSLEYTFGGDIDVGVHFFSDSEEIDDRYAPFVGAAGLFVGLPLGKVIELRARGEALHVGGPGDADDAVVFGALGGLRLGRWFPFFLEALGGWGVPFGTEPGFLEPDWLGEITVGLHFANAFDCGVGFQAGHRIRFGGIAESDQQNAYFSIGLTLGLTYDNLIRAAECPI